MSHHHHHSQCCAHTNLKFCSCCNTAYCVDCGYEWKNRAYATQWYYPYGNQGSYTGTATVTGSAGNTTNTLGNYQVALSTTNCSHKPDANL